MRSKKAPRRLRPLEMLEQRIALAVDIGLENGLLSITSDVGGALAVNIAEEPPASGNFELRVSSNGSLVGDPVPLADLTLGLHLSLTGEGAAADDAVTIDLGGQTLPRVSVDLGDGENSLSLAGGNVSGSVFVRGGSGGDDVTVADGVGVGGALSLSLGGGENTASIAGDARIVTVRTGADGDALTLESTASVDRLFASLGGGTNETTVSGEVTGVASVHGGSGDDTLSLAGSANHLLALLGNGTNAVNIEGTIERSVVISTHGNGADTVNVTGGVGGQLLVNLAGGTNSLTVDGAVGGNVGYHGSRGDDTVTLTSDASVGGNVAAHMGNGVNTFASQALVANNVLVITTNPQDATRITVEEASVGGQTLIRTARPRLRDLLDRLIDLFN